MLNFGMKKRAKIAISLIYFSVQTFARLVKKLCGYPPREYLTILYYHSVPSQHKAAFATQMAALRRSAHVVNADCQDPLSPGKKHVALTFDDAFCSVYDNALPVLAAHSFPATIFVPVGFIGRSPSWAMEDDNCDRRESVMTVDQLKACPVELVTLGSHSVSHQQLAQISSDGAREEIEKSGQKLSALIGRKVRLFAFPYGSYDSSVTELCKSAGYRYAFSINSEHVDTACSDIIRGRTKVDPTDGPIEFYLKCSGAYVWTSQVNSFVKRLGRGAGNGKQKQEKSLSKIDANPSRLYK